MKKSLLALLLSIGISGAANAGLIGDTVNTDLLHSGISYGAGFSSIVGNGPEGAIFGNQQVNFGDFTFTIQSLNNFCGMSCGGELIELKLSSLDLGGITGVSFATTLAGVSMNFGSDFVTFSWVDQNLNSSAPYISATFETGTQNVPEPGSLVLLGMSMAGLGIARYRQKA
ncbi:PEP-CTERM sorting domain-containing protein [Dechloromonas sp. A34]|uniref:PEP-CTERM sorting domain-containing protein n=1 Tax=Dechloromonas sp. A34 TaxID=447588 RepID=UPI002248F16A|nr:PEP-CTERM sorting domain-containing protein [Dechloromonas sp. A34]